MCYRRTPTNHDVGDHVPAVQHPRLAELDRLAAEAEANPTPDEEVITPSEPVAEAEPTPEVASPEVEAREPEEDFFLKLDKRNPYQSLREIAAKEKVVNDAIETMAGRRGKARFGPEVESLKAERDALKAEIKRRDYEKLTGAEVTERFGTDAQFAQDYAQVVHAKPIDVAAIQQAQQIKVAFNTDLENAERAGVPIEKLTLVENWVNQGAFDRTADGRVLSPIESYRWFREVVDNEVAAARIVTTPQPARAPEPQAAAAPAAVAVAEKRTPTPNPRLQEASPDLSASSHSSGGIQRITKQELDDMNPIQRGAMWRTNADFEAFVRAGGIIDA